MLVKIHSAQRGGGYPAELRIRSTKRLESVPAFGLHRPSAPLRAAAAVQRQRYMAIKQLGNGYT